MFIGESYTLRVFWSTKYLKNYEKTYTVYKGFKCLANGGQNNSVVRENRNTGVWSMLKFILNDKRMLAYFEGYFFAMWGILLILLK